MIEILQVTHQYAQKTVLQHLNVQLTERRIAIVGANGSGKSTFARLLNGLQIPTEGTVLIDGLNTKTQGKLIRRKVGFVFQNPDNQIIFPLVEEDLAFGLKNLQYAPHEIEERIQKILAYYALTALRQHSTHQLSGGQKQLLALSSVLIMNPEYIVLDEPTTLLDLRHKRRFAQAIDQLPQTVIAVSHDLDFLRDFERVLVFEDGAIVMDDHPDIALAYYRTLME